MINDFFECRMFKTDLPMGKTLSKLLREEGWAFMGRGMAANTTAVALPVAMTIFLTDVLIDFKRSFKQ